MSRDSIHVTMTAQLRTANVRQRLAAREVVGADAGEEVEPLGELGAQGPPREAQLVEGVRQRLVASEQAGVGGRK